MAVNGNFNDCINSFSDEVQTTVEDILQNSDRDYLMEIPDDSLFNNGNIQFKNLLDDIDLDYKLSPDDNATDQVKSQIENHNTNIANKCKEFVVTSTFLNVINSRVQVFVESDMAEEAKFFNAIALILDFEVSLFLNVDPIFKQVYYDSILKNYKTIVSYLNGGYREILVLFGDKGSHYFEKVISKYTFRENVIVGDVQPFD